MLGASEMVEDSNFLHVQTLELKNSSIYGLIALAASLTWAILIVFCMLDKGLPVSATFDLKLFQFKISHISFLIGAICAFLITTFAKHLMKYGVKLLTNVVAIFGCVPLFLIFLAPSVFSTPGFLLLAWALSGCVFVILFYRGALFFSSVSTLYEGFLVCLGSSGGALLLCIANAYASSWLIPLFLAALPAASVAFFTLAKMSLPIEDNFDSVELEPSWTIDPVLPLSLQVFACVIVGILISEGGGGMQGLRGTRRLSLS